MLPFALSFQLDLKLPPELEALPQLLAVYALALSLLLVTLIYLLFNKNAAARLAGVALVGTCALWLLNKHPEAIPGNKPHPVAPAPGPTPAPTPKPEEPKAPRRPLLPWREQMTASHLVAHADVFAATNSIDHHPEHRAIGAMKTGGPVSPDSKVEVATDLPVELRKKNVGGRDGAGLCVFTSIMHAARWQSERKLDHFQDQMKAELGGGWPEKVDRMIAKYAPGVDYIQYEGKDPAVLVAALKSGRMPGVTYNGRDPHYRGSIAHMVNLVAYDEAADWAAILDNNFVGEQELVWMSCAEFKSRWCGNGNGWAVILLAPAPPPPPTNPKTPSRYVLEWRP